MLNRLIVKICMILVMAPIILPFVFIGNTRLKKYFAYKKDLAETKNDFDNIKRDFYDDIKSFHDIKEDVTVSIEGKPYGQDCGLDNGKTLCGMFNKSDSIWDYNKNKGVVTLFAINTVNMSNGIKCLSRLLLIINYVHEMCHAKQYESGIDIFTNYIDFNANYSAYKEQDIEVEARHTSKVFILKNLGKVLKTMFK